MTEETCNGGSEGSPQPVLKIGLSNRIMVQLHYPQPQIMLTVAQ